MQLSRHKSSMHSIAKAEFQCKICQKEFPRKDNFVRHEKTCKEKAVKAKNEHSCAFCDKSFGRIDTLKKYMKTHTVKEEVIIDQIREYPCQMCDKVYTQRQNLHAHKVISYGRVVDFGESGFDMLEDNNKELYM